MAISVRKSGPIVELAKTMAIANGIQIAKTTMRLWRTEKRASEESMGVLFGGTVASLGYETEHCDGYMAVPFR